MEKDDLSKINPEIAEEALVGIKEFLREYQLSESEQELGFAEATKMLTYYISFCETKLSKLCERYSKAHLLLALSLYEETYMKPLYEVHRDLQSSEDSALIGERIRIKSEAYLTAKLATLKFGSDTGWLLRSFAAYVRNGQKPTLQQVFGNREQEVDIRKILFWSEHHVWAQYSYRSMQRMSLCDSGIKLMYDPLGRILRPFLCSRFQDEVGAQRAAENAHFYFERILAEEGSPTQLKYRFLRQYQPLTLPLYSHIDRGIFFFDLLKSYEYYNLVRESIEEKFGFTLEDMYAFLSALGECLTTFIGSVTHSAQFTGIYYAPKKGLIDDISEIFKEHYDTLLEKMHIPRKNKMKSQNWRRRVHLLTNRFTMRTPHMKKLDLWSARPLLPLQDVEINFVSCDLSSILTEYLNNVFWQAEIGEDEPDKDIKGPKFEEHLNELISKYCKMKFLGPRNKVKDAQTGRLVTDIDLSYVVDELLMVIECKARTVNQRFFKGDAKYTFSRWNDMCGWIDKVDGICRGLTKGDLRSTIMEQGARLGATHILPVVCTLSPQYLLDYNERMILSDSGPVREYIPIPRVCTPFELISFLRTINAQDLIKKPYVLEIEKT